MTRIFIIGAGAIGKALAVFLTQQNRQVVILRGSVDNIQPYHEEFEVIVSEQQSVRAKVEISSLSNYKNLDGIVVLTNKSFGNMNLARELKDKVGATPIVLLQNGLKVELPFMDDFDHVYRCVLFATSQVTSQASLRFKPVSLSPIGLIKGNRSELERVVEALDTPAFRFKAVENIEEIIWKKVIANCVFNSICPLLEIDNGIFHRNADALSIANHVIEECATIARAVGINVRDHEIMETVLMISKASDGQLISTLQDIKNKRETEIESMNFAIMKIAEEKKLSHLVPTTSVLGQMTKLKSKLALG